MTYIKLIIFIIAVLGVQSVFAQKSVEPINLFSGSIEEIGLPTGWVTSVDNLDCTIKFTSNKQIYFERQSPDEKCSFAFTKALPEGNYVLKTKFKIGGSAAEIFLDGAPLKKTHTIKVVDGQIRVGIQTKSSGKAWGWIESMTLTRSTAK